MSDPLNLTIVYEPGDDGWIAVSIPEVPGVFSQGRTRKEARDMVLSALNDWLRFYVEDQASDKLGEIPADADTEPVYLRRRARAEAPSGDHTGTTPCRFHGRSTFLLWDISSARQIVSRVSRGSITSSMRSLPAAM
jgi:predicted RNase H-like HicB family nuclease